MNKFLIFLILIVGLIVSGCSSNSNDFNQYINDQNYFNKNINLEGEVKLYQDGFYYIVDSNDVKIKLIDCEDKYNLVLGKNILLNGYLLKEENKISFACKSYETSIQNLTSEVDKLNQEIFQNKQELESIKTEKQNKINSLNNQINSKTSQLKELTYKVDNSTKQKEIEDVKNEILDRAKSFPNTPKVEDFQKWIMLGMEPYKTDTLRQGCCSTIGYKDWYYKKSAINSNYSLTISAVRSPNTDYYNSYNIQVERFDEKYTCTKTN